MRNYVVLFILFIAWPSYSAAQNQAFSGSSPPDLKGWIEVSRSRIEVVISESASVYLGLDIEYRNPSDPDEFVRVISKHIPVPFEEQEPPNDRLISQVVLSKYVERDRANLLEIRARESDPVIYAKWRIKKDPLTGVDVRDGDVDIWFRSNNGKWLFGKNEEIRVESMSENISNGQSRNVLMGRKYSFLGAYNIFKPSRNDVILAMEGVEK